MDDRVFTDAALPAKCDATILPAKRKRHLAESPFLSMVSGQLSAADMRRSGVNPAQRATVDRHHWLFGLAGRFCGTAGRRDRLPCRMIHRVPNAHT